MLPQSHHGDHVGEADYCPLIDDPFLPTVRYVLRRRPCCRRRRRRRRRHRHHHNPRAWKMYYG